MWCPLCGWLEYACGRRCFFRKLFSFISFLKCARVHNPPQKSPNIFLYPLHNTKPTALAVGFCIDKGFRGIRTTEPHFEGWLHGFLPATSPLFLEMWGLSYSDTSYSENGAASQKRRSSPWHFYSTAVKPAPVLHSHAQLFPQVIASYCLHRIRTQSWI